MRKILRNTIQWGILIVLSLLWSGCGITESVSKRTHGFTEYVHRAGPPPSDETVEHKPKPAYALLYPVSLPLDIVTSPIQVLLFLRWTGSMDH